jgi:hypothetical protein
MHIFFCILTEFGTMVSVKLTNIGMRLSRNISYVGAATQQVLLQLGALSVPRATQRATVLSRAATFVPGTENSTTLVQI